MLVVNGVTRFNFFFIDIFILMGKKRPPLIAMTRVRRGRGIYSSNLPQGGGQKTCTFGENQGRKPVPDRFFLFYTQKFDVLNIFRKIVA